MLKSLFRTAAVLSVLSATGMLAGCGKESGPKAIEAQRSKEKSNDEAWAVVEKAVAAHGGAERLERLRQARVTYRIKGKLPILPGYTDLDLSITETYRLPDRIKKVIKGTADGRRVNVAWAADQDRYWYWEQGEKLKIIRKETELESQYRPFDALEELAIAEEFQWTIMKDPSEAREGSIALRCRADASEEGQICYFDRTTGLLAGFTFQQKIPGARLAARKELRMSDYKVIAGLQLYRKLKLFLDGKNIAEVSVESVQLLDELNGAVFAPPPER